MELLKYTGCLDSVPQLVATIQEAVDCRVSSQGVISGSRMFQLVQQNLTVAMSMRMGTVLRKF